MEEPVDDAVSPNTTATGLVVFVDPAVVPEKTANT
jgi:hypothetical protein